MTKIKTIAIIGLGLMGGSLAAACRKKFPKAKIVGISRDLSALQKALRKNWIHEISQKPEQGVREADLIILCTPINTFPDLVMMCDRFAKQGAIVTDVGSLKGEIDQFLTEFPTKRIYFVGSHPMVGSHSRGVDFARPDLYVRGLVFVVDSKISNRDSFNTVIQFWKKLGANVVKTSSKKHDQIVSEISHLPHAAAVALVLSVSGASRRFASSGFKDTTRVAQGDSSIWAPIFLSNATNLLRDLGKFESEIKKIKKILIKSDQRKMISLLDKAKRKRAQISL